MAHHINPSQTFNRCAVLIVAMLQGFISQVLEVKSKRRSFIRSINNCNIHLAFLELQPIVRICVYLDYLTFTGPEGGGLNI